MGRVMGGKQRTATRCVLRVLAALWAAPTTLLGCGFGWLGRGRLRVAAGALEFTGHRFVGCFTPAVTLGHAIIYAAAEPGEATRAHELQHTLQAAVLGPLYLPAHVVMQLVAFAYSFADRSRRYRSVNDRVHSPANLLETGPMSHPPRPWP